MIHGIDTGFLVAALVVEHSDHDRVRRRLADLLAVGDHFALAPQVIAEFIHVVTDPRRFAEPLNITAARDLAEQWWTASDVDQVFPNEKAVRQFLLWLRQHKLGRKRLLDTLLAATYSQAGVQSILTNNPSDFAVFDNISCISP